MPALLVVSPHASARSRNSSFTRARNASASSDNLVANGSFESPSAGGDFTTYHVGDTFGGWTVGQNSVDLAGPRWNTACGNQSVDLTGTPGAGSVLQDLATSAGTTYHVQFQLAGNTDGGSRVMTVEVRWDGQLLSTFTFDTTGHSGADMGWVREDIPATASGSSTRLEFRSLTDGSYGPVIDDVSVSTSPLPPCSAPPSQGSCGSIQGVDPFGVPIDPVPGQATVPLVDVWVGSFVGPDTTPLSCYSAKIDWGDGQSSAGVVHPFVSGSLCELACKVLGTHTYSNPGHHVPDVSVSLCDTNGCSASLPITDTDNRVELDVSPPTTGARRAVGVLTSDNGPQCTATVVNLARSFEPANPSLRQKFQKHRDDFNGNVVVTAAHCIESRGGYMFAPSFTGIAPRYSYDFSTGKVSAEHNDQFGVGSPFEGERIGHAPLGVWGCSHHKYADRRCGHGGSRDAEVFVPDLFKSGDNSYDYAFVVFRTAPPNRPRSLVGITGGLPIDFDAGVPKGKPLRSIAYDVTWVDANRPGDTSGWYDLVTPPDGEELNTAGGNCGDGPAGYHAESCSYSYLASSAGPRTCAPTVDGYFNLTIPAGKDAILPESRSSLLASQCNSGGFASGAPYIMLLLTGEHVVVGVNKTTFHAGPQTDPVAGACCTAIITPLRHDAAFHAFLAELLK